MMKLRVIFAGTPEFALPTLQGLVRSEFDVVAALTQPDRPKGRGRRLTAPPVKQFAEEQGLSLLQTGRITADLIDEAASLKPDVIVVVAFGMLLPPDLLALPRYCCINVHASLLPRWRGAAPVARAIEAGDCRTGATIMQMDAGLDTGPILSQAECPIESRDNAAALQEKLASLGARQLLKTLGSLPYSLQNATPQDDAQATYAAKLTAAESFIDWQLPAVEIVRKVQAYNPWPMARTYCRGVGLRIWTAEHCLCDTSGFAAGEVIESSARGIVVSAGQGAVRILSLQREGRRQMRAQDFLSGFPIASGSMFSRSASPD